MHFAKEDKLARYRTALSINTVVAILQLCTVVFLADSLALFGDMTHSFSDVFILAGTAYIIRREIADSGHGHRGAKRLLVGLAITLLWISACYVGWEAIERIKHPVGFPGWPVAAMALLSALGNFVAHRVIARVEHSEHDAMHEANIAHLLTDFLLSFIVLLSALGNILFDLPAIDAWLSLGVALWMLNWGWRILKNGDPHAHTHAHAHDNVYFLHDTKDDGHEH